MERILECVPNFSEGRDRAIIDKIAASMQAVDGVSVLDIDPGASTNRTVITLAGVPEAVAEAAFQGIRTAAEWIDMRKHTGEHPRMGATDVCPFVPIQGVTVEEAVQLAHQLAKRVAQELNIPVYLYEYAAQEAKRKSLASIRAGEYEGLPQKLTQPAWKPDYGAPTFNARSGATVIGVRDFLIAYNVNLNTESVRKANSVAFDVREAGRILRNGDPITGEVVKDATGETVRVPGKLKEVRGIGWFIEEYGIAQVSMNLTNMHITPLHLAFEACMESAASRGMRVTGSELVGLVPLQALLEAGKYFLQKQGRSVGVDEKTLIKIAVKSLGLDDLAPFVPEQKIIEYKLRNQKGPLLVHKTVSDFADTVANEGPAPGGGSVSALMGSLGAALGSMVANGSANKRGWEDKIPELGEVAAQLQAIKAQLLVLVDEDTAAFNRVMEAYALPKATDAEKSVRKNAIEQANQTAARIPLQIAETALQAFGGVQQMAEHGNPNAITDAGVAALALHAAIQGACYNVRINLGGITDATVKAELQHAVQQVLAAAAQAAQRVALLVEAKL